MTTENHSGRSANETITITVSKRFADDARGLAALFGYGGDELGEAIESIAGWWLQTLREDDGGELIATAESHLWRSEAACRAFAKRLQEKVPDAEIKVYQETRGWRVEITPPGMILRDSRRAAG
jgi:hypothetical protein